MTKKCKPKKTKIWGVPVECNLEKGHDGLHRQLKQLSNPDQPLEIEWGDDVQTEDEEPDGCRAHIDYGNNTIYCGLNDNHAGRHLINTDDYARTVIMIWGNKK